MSTVQDRPGWAPSLVWSQAFSLDDISDRDTNMQRIRGRVRKLQRHWNSYEELSSAERYISKRDVKAAVRSASSAVEASMKFYSDEWGVRFPTGRNLSFGNRIDQVLLSANRVAFSNSDPESFEIIGRLYKARSSMHEGACRYRDEATDGYVDVRLPEARTMVDAAEKFCLWVDAHA
jgi:hypothetical protein